MPTLTDTLTAGLNAGTEFVDMGAALAEARAAPWRWRLADDVRAGHEREFTALCKYDCHGPLVAAIARALRLDEEARRAQG